jgi:hypothetical protein
LPRPVPPWMKSGLKRRFRRWRASRGVEGDLVRLADDEIVEAVARLELGGVEARLFGAERSGSAPGSRPVRRCGRLASPPARIARRGRRGSAYARRAPAVGEMGLHPIGHELGREVRAARCRYRRRTAERDRAQPPIECARTAVAAKPGTDHVPSRENRFGTLVSVSKATPLAGVWLTHAPLCSCRPKPAFTRSKLSPFRQTPPGDADSEHRYAVLVPLEDSPPGRFLDRAAANKRKSNFVKYIALTRKA